MFPDPAGGSIRGATTWPANSSVGSTSFMGILRAKTGLTFDLPTDAQWEYACRAGTTTALNSGKNLINATTDASMAAVGRYAGNTGDGKGGYSGQHTTVGSYLPNNWGLYDMHGNVMELCLDWFLDGLGGNAVVDPVGPTSGINGTRIDRGGGFFYNANACRSAHRNNVSPDNVASFVGFRAVILLGN